MGVVGRTGSGKSSLVACLFRLTEIQSGSITIDGLDTRNARLSDLRRAIGVVMQDSLVFAGNARRNLFAPPGTPDHVRPLPGLQCRRMPPACPRTSARTPPPMV